MLQRNNDILRSKRFFFNIVCFIDALWFQDILG